jgi:hypothetical protein
VLDYAYPDEKRAAFQCSDDNINRFVDWSLANQAEYTSPISTAANAGHEDAAKHLRV